MGLKKPNHTDPLFQLFEHFLVTRSYEDANEFTRQLAEEYLVYLDSTPAHIPFESRETALEDIANEAHEMLVKKMYGCGEVNEHENYGSVVLIENDGKDLDSKRKRKASSRRKETTQGLDFVVPEASGKSSSKSNKR